ncbi:hypothetical protein D3C87_45470 [compost metagenome]
MKTLTLYRLLLYVSLFSLVYFMYLVYIFYFPLKDEGVMRFVGELITIPLLLFTVFAFIFSLYKIIRKTEIKKYLIVFMLNIATIILWVL